MNPLRWRREHQIALVLFAAVGAAAGAVVGYMIWNAGFGGGMSFSYYLRYPYHNGFYHWGAFGAVIGGAIVYAIQLIRTPKG